MFVALKRIRLVPLVVTVAVLPSMAAAQAPAESNNAIYLELFGNGGVYSLNYEREILNGVRARVGIGAWETESFFGGGSTSLTTVPLTVSKVFGAGAHHLEAGGGLLLGSKHRPSSLTGAKGFTTLTGILGYRFLRSDGRFLFRAVATPFYGFGEGDDAYPDEGFLPSCGVSFGFAF